MWSTKIRLTGYISFILVAAFILCGSAYLHAAAGDPDPTFGSNGLVTTNFGAGVNGRANAMVIQSGKIIAVGFAASVAGTDFALARYNADGSLDSTFGSGGIVLTDFAGTEDVAMAAAIDSNGKIVVGGVSGLFEFALARYNPDGSLDSSFDADGKVTTDLGDTGYLYAIAIQPDGKIVAAGYTYSSTGDFALARYNPDGSLDTGFDADGKVITDIGPGNEDLAYALAVQADGKIIAAGESNSHFVLARYRPDGSLDPSFDWDGIVLTDFGTYQESAYAVAVQPDGKIVAAGFAASNVDDFALARYNPDGSLDNTFGGDGTVTTDFSGSEDIARAVAIQADGKIVIAGFVTSSAQYDFGLARYTANGALDTTFSYDGKVATDFGATYDQPSGVAIQSDERIVAAGYTADGVHSDFALVRYLGDEVCGVTLSPTSLPNGNVGLAYNQTISATGGTPPYTYVVSAGTLPAGLSLDANSGLISGTPTTEGSSSFTITATDSHGCSANQGYSINIGAACLFCDDFEDGVRSPDWTYLKPEWTESGGFLRGTPTGKKAIAIADPAFAGCQTCYVETVVQIAGGEYNKVWILGWYADKKDDMELLIKQESGRIVLKERYQGLVVAKNKGLTTINPNTSYTIRITFDGSLFTVSVDRNPLFTLDPAAAVPTGTVGFEVKNTTGLFDSILVN